MNYAWNSSIFLLQLYRLVLVNSLMLLICSIKAVYIAPFICASYHEGFDTDQLDL